MYSELIWLWWVIINSFTFTINMWMRMYCSMRMCLCEYVSEGHQVRCSVHLKLPVCLFVTFCTVVSHGLLGNFCQGSNTQTNSQTWWTQTETVRTSLKILWHKLQTHKTNTHPQQLSVAAGVCVSHGAFTLIKMEYFTRTNRTVNSCTSAITVT